ncbi:MAG: DUF5056 domain-containing protein [Bacteroidales bacterium]|jgi:hypothetical protein|nr:DUF5056 domain-containing protein [Bacteroidales bacterium]MDD3201232.1 DUF5056 domain-containing protein [Bacteroidales bacterium]
MRKDKQVDQFLKAHKQQIDGEEFNRKTIERLNYYHPIEAKKKRGTKWIVNLFAFICIAIFVLSGGAKTIFDAAMVVFSDPRTIHSIANYASIFAMLALITGGIIYIEEMAK